MTEHDEELVKSIHELVESNRKLIKGPPIWRTFLVGAISAIGATVGAAIVIGLLAAILNQLAGIDLIKPFVQPVLPYIEKTQNKSPSSTAAASPSPTSLESPTPDGSPTDNSYNSTNQY